MGFLLLLLCCLSAAEAKVYRVEDVPMVHLADRTRYVSNPDGILSSASMATIDSLLFVLEEKTGIQVLVAVLGDMLELGGDSLNEHMSVIRSVASRGFGSAFFVGKEFMSASGHVHLTDDMMFFESSDELAGYLQKEQISGSTILIKGSRGTRMEKVIPAL